MTTTASPTTPVTPPAQGQDLGSLIAGLQQQQAAVGSQGTPQQTAPSGQAAFDLLAGIGGHPIDRAGLNSYVQNAQATNGLKSAQTELALVNAQRGVEAEQAASQFESALVANNVAPSDAHLIAVSARMNSNNPAAASQTYNAILDSIKVRNTQTASDPSQLGTAAQTAALQGLSGKPAEPVAVPGTFTVPAGMPQPVIQETPGQIAQDQLHIAAAHKDAQTQAPLDPNAIAFAAYQNYKTGRMPALGMGGGAARLAILHGSAALADREANGDDISNPGYDHAIANGQDFTGAQRSINSAAGGTMANKTQALNNVVGHLGLYDQMYSALQQGDMQAINTASAAWKKQFGSAAPINLQTAAQIIGPELTKIMTQSNAGTGDERASFGQTAGNLANSPDQTHQAIDTLRQMLGRQAADMALQYHGATGRTDFASRYLQPDVAQALHLDSNSLAQIPAPGGAPSPNAGHVAAAGAGAGALPTAAAAQLQAGKITHFGNGTSWTIGPDGKPQRVL
jgi:hypothetical protein